MKAQKPKPPRVGQTVEVYGIKCRIFKIHPAGTIDVQEIGGPKAWRLTGLWF